MFTGALPCTFSGVMDRLLGGCELVQFYGNLTWKTFYFLVANLYDFICTFSYDRICPSDGYI